MREFGHALCSIARLETSRLAARVVYEGPFDRWLSARQLHYVPMETTRSLQRQERRFEMSATLKHHHGHMPAPHVSPSPTEKDLHHDRWTALVVRVTMITLTGLVLWLASQNGANLQEVPDHWYMMP